MPELMKSELVEHLQNNDMMSNSILSLWGNAKTYYREKGIPMGGGYASIGTEISVTLNLEGEMIRFKVDLSEVI